jgi:hypothetical protein
MAFLNRKLDLSFVFLLALVSAVQSKFCYKPSIRREWNALSETEQAAWISAVKVRVEFPLKFRLNVLPVCRRIAPR